MGERCTIDEGLPSELICTGYKDTIWTQLLRILFVLCTGGLGLLIFYWKPDWRLKFFCFPCNFSCATHVLLESTDDYKQKFVSRIHAMSTEQAMLMDTFYGNSRDENKAVTSGENGRTLYFYHHSLRFLLNSESQTFVELGSLDKRASVGEIFKHSTCGLMKAETENRLALFGPNLINVEVPSWFKLLVTEILNPFYIFQVVAMVLWIMDGYWLYSIVIIVSAIVSAIVSLFEVRRTLVKLHDMVASHNKTKTPIIRVNNHGQTISEEIPSEDVVPGDVIQIPQEGIELACDAVLISGVCIVNESMLTGESVPVTKTPLPNGESQQNEIYSTQNHKRHTLFCGTKVIQTRHYAGEIVKAVVVRSGFQTAKGRLVHSILYPKPLNMKLLRDAYRFVGILATIAIVGFVYTAIVKSKQGEPPEAIVMYAFLVITAAVPPALPVAMVIGIVYAQRRLSNQSINCISSGRISISGQIDVVAFDKTGTITEDGLAIYQLLPTTTSTKSISSKNMSFDKAISPNDIRNKLDQTDNMLRGLASCHTLTQIGGKLQGDPMDMILFEATGWNVIEAEVGVANDSMQTNRFISPGTQIASKSDVNSSPNELGIVRNFTFESQLQRASVIVHPNGASKSEMIVYTNGSPEKVATLCLPHTIPEDFDSSLKLYTQQGYRMIAIAYKHISLTWPESQKIERTKVEQDLTFLGLIALQNKLKPESKAGIKELMDADIRTLMVTGDNLLTALSVAREVGMIHAQDDVILAETKLPQDHDDVTKPTLTFTYTDSPSNSESHIVDISDVKETRFASGYQVGPTYKNWHLAVSGNDFANIKTHFPEWMEMITVKGAVFARMSPDQKTELVEELDDIGYHVCMCGDGANDCGALKRAHVGISLSEHEASVAAPFTSALDHGTKCVPLLIREGRAALVTSFGMLRFMGLYSITQFCGMCILFWNSTNFTVNQFLYVDLLIVDAVALTMPRNYPCKELHVKKPPNSIMSMEMLASLAFNLILQLVIQISSDSYLVSRCWYNNLNIGKVNESVFLNQSTCNYNLTFVDQSNIVDPQGRLSYNSENLLLVSAFMYLSVSFVFSTGHPFRTPIYKNRPFLVSLAVLYALSIFLVFGAPLNLQTFMDFRVFPEESYKWSLLLFALVHFILSFSMEKFVVEQPAVWSWVRSKFNQGKMGKWKQLQTLIESRSVEENLKTSTKRVLESNHVVCLVDAADQESTALIGQAQQQQTAVISTKI